MKYIQQLDETDCGAACLAMIASYFKSRISITRIREYAGTDKNGTNLNGMIIAAKAIGLNSHALCGEKKHLTPDLPVPFIAHLRITDEGGELLHYVIVSRVTKNKVYVYDPDPVRGKSSYTIDKFCEYWSGYCIFLAPSNNFTLQKNDKKGFLGKFLPLLKPYKGLLAVVCLISFLLIFFGIVSSFYFQYVIDEIVYSEGTKTLTVLSVGVLILTLFRILLTAIRSFMLTVFSIKIDFHLIFAYFSHVLHLPVSFYDTRKTGEILSRMQDAQKIRNALTDAAISVVMDTAMVFIVGIVLFVRNKTLFGISVIAVPLSSIIVWLTAKPFAKQYRKAMGQNAEVESYLVETMNGGTTVKAMNASEYSFYEYEKLQTKAIWTSLKLTRRVTMKIKFITAIAFFALISTFAFSQQKGELFDGFEHGNYWIWAGTDYDQYGSHKYSAGTNISKVWASEGTHSLACRYESMPENLWWCDGIYFFDGEQDFSGTKKITLDIYNPTYYGFTVALIIQTTDNWNWHQSEGIYVHNGVHNLEFDVSDYTSELGKVMRVSIQLSTSDRVMEESDLYIDNIRLIK